LTLFAGIPPFRRELHASGGKYGVELRAASYEHSLPNKYSKGRLYYWKNQMQMSLDAPQMMKEKKNPG